MTDYQAQQAARNVAAQALAAANPHLIPVWAAKHSRDAACKNIRIELKRAFPGIKFSVKGDSFSGGDSIDVRWTDGPTTAQVDAIIGRYSAGSFNGMEDIYEYSRDAWTDAFGDAKYVHSSRANSDRAIESAIRTAVAKYGIEPVTVEDFRAGRLWGRTDVGGFRDLQDLISRTVATRTWAINKTPAPKPMVEAEAA